MDGLESIAAAALPKVVHSVNYVSHMPPFTMNEDFDHLKELSLNWFKTHHHDWAPDGTFEVMAEVSAFYRVAFFVSFPLASVFTPNHAMQRIIDLVPATILSLFVREVKEGIRTIMFEALGIE